MTGTSFLCLDPRVPLELRSLADDRAAAVRPDNAPGPFEAAGQPRRFWGTGMELRVRFLDLPELAPVVLEAAAAWTDEANLDLRVVRDGDAEIRVTFRGTGNWSALGTDALVPDLYPADRPTLCLSELRAPESSTRVDRLIRHEFGHALGLVHEHSSPAAGMRWDKPVVYAALTGEPFHWTRADVDRELFARYDASTTNHTEFDLHSVMLYPCPPEWTIDRRELGMNHELSPTDRAFIRDIYPGRSRTDPG